MACGKWSSSYIWTIVVSILYFVPWVWIHEADGALPQVLNSTSSFSSHDGFDFQKIIINDKTGDIFIGGTNCIHQLTSNLDLLDSQSSLSEESSFENSNCFHSTELNNTNSVLLLDLDKDILIACGKALNGTCFVYNSYRISNVKDWVNNRDSRELNSLGLGRSVVAFVGNVPQTEEKGYYIGATFEDSLPYEGISQHAVSTKRLTEGNDGQWSFEYGFANPTYLRYTYINILSPYRSSFKVEYVHGFTSGNYSYFLTVQKSGLSSQDYITRIVRICTQDKSYYSYIEMDLVCRQRNKKSTVYNLLQAAYVGYAGEVLASDLEVEASDEVLYGVFAASEEEDTNHPSSNSALCVYTMATITQKFTRGLQNCFDKKQGSQGLPYMSSDSLCSLVSGIPISDDFCGTGQLHPVEMNVKAVSKDYLLGGGEDFQFTSIAVAVDGNDTIAIMGTSDGSLMKYIVEPFTVEGSSRTYSSIPFKHLQLDSPGPVLKDMPFDLTKEYLYVMTATKVYKVKVSTCAHYVECSACVSTHDPNNCGWCGGSCTTKAECRMSGQNLEWNQSVCSPAIFQVSPTTAPLTGGTMVSIIGDNLGFLVGRGVHMVSIAGQPCQINETASNLHKFTCAVPAVSFSVQGDVAVHVDVHDPNGGFHITGNASSPANYRFTFAEPTIIYFEPPNGPSLGGTILSIHGNHLDAGNTQTVSVAGKPCVVTSVDNQLLICITSEGQENTSGKVTVRFDTYTATSREKFTYSQDPSISSYKPHGSIVSGGIVIYVEGHTFDSVQTMALVVNVSSSSLLYKGACKITSGTNAECLSPDLTSAQLEVASEMPATLTFELNGVMISDPATFMIYPDPIVDQLQETQEHVTGSNIMITGVNFKLSDSLPNPSIFVEGRPCRVTYIDNYEIQCSLPNLPFQESGDQGYLVEMQMGNFNQTVGRVIILPRVSNPAILIAVILAILVAFILLLLVICLIRKRKAKTGSYTQTAIDDNPVENVVIFRNGPSNEDTATIATAAPVPNTYLRHPSQLDSPDIVIGGAAAAETQPLLERIPKDIAMQISDVLVQEDNLTLGDVLGRGHFGCVYEGRYFQDGREMHVAVKSLLRGATSDISSFLMEGIMMKDFDHPNVLALIGVCITRENQPLVILPFMANGDLLSYVRDPKNELTMRELLHFCRQIAEGMAYLASLKFVHRDLAARNCMLDTSSVAKVADFGLSRDIYEKDYYSGKDKTIKLPVRWMALECLERNIYNTKTDVWSYGVVMWEIITRGMSPYSTVDNWDLTLYLQRGRRLSQPDHCPDHVFQIMLSTWSASSVDRPSFAMLLQQLRDLLAEKAEGPDSPDEEFDQSYINVPGL